MTTQNAFGALKWAFVSIFDVLFVKLSGYLRNLNINQLLLRKPIVLRMTQ